MLLHITMVVLCVKVSVIAMNGERGEWRPVNLPGLMPLLKSQGTGVDVECGPLESCAPKVVLLK